MSTEGDSGTVEPSIQFTPGEVDTDALQPANASDGDVGVEICHWCLRKTVAEGYRIRQRGSGSSESKSLYW
jgi:hypothetical protein